MSLHAWLRDRIIHYFIQEPDLGRSYLCDFDRIGYEVRPGDVLLVEGHSRLSELVQKVTASPWSHCMLYLGRLYDIEAPEVREIVQQHYAGPLGDQLVIESVIGKGTVITPLAAYENLHMRICRPTGISHREAQAVIRHAVGTLGRAYDIRHVIDLGRFLLMYQWFLPWRWRSTLFEDGGDRTEKDICSKMVADAFGSINFPILPEVSVSSSNELTVKSRNKNLCIPRDFDYSPYFNIIKYPLLDLLEPR